MTRERLEEQLRAARKAAAQARETLEHREQRVRELEAWLKSGFYVGRGGAVQVAPPGDDLLRTSGTVAPRAEFADALYRAVVRRGA